MRHYIQILVIQLVLLLFIVKLNAQEQITYSYHYKASTNPEDSLPTLYCAFIIEELKTFESITLTYNEKQRTFAVKDLKKMNPDRYFVEKGKVYIKVPERLKIPYLVIEGTKKNGQKKDFYALNARGDVIDTRIAKAKWKRHKARVDSMDFVRKYDNIYKGDDGLPRYKTKNGRTFIIYKDHIQEEVKPVSDSIPNVNLKNL